MENHFLLLPRGYLSSSQCDLWEKNKQEYRDRYYIGKKPPQTIYTLFGSEVHKMIEEADPKVSFIPRFGTREKKIETYIDGVPVLGYIDEVSFVDADVYYDDTKTGLKAWTDSEVRKHHQLPFYAMILQEKYGTQRHFASITWIGTERVSQRGWDEEEHTSLQLTGEFRKYLREIEQWEIDRQRERIVKIAKEVSADYRHHILLL